MKIRIKEMNGNPACNGFFPVAGVKIMPSRYVIEDGNKVWKDGDVYECESEDHFHQCLETGKVEAVIEPRKPGRPRKDTES